MGTTGEEVREFSGGSRSSRALWSMVRTGAVLSEKRALQGSEQRREVA